MSNLIITCPNCNICIEIIQLNCKIFRCGIYKDTFAQMPPHLPKYECYQLYIKGLIYGCGQPFLIDESNTAIKCGYI